MSQAPPKLPQAQEPAGWVCDFCGERVPSVRRVAMDGDYERLLTPHRERYACPTCSARKEQERRGLPPAR